VTATDSWNADAYAASARFVSDYGREVIDLLNPQPGEHILDLGCGDGALSANLLSAGARVTAVDASPSMVAAACRAGIDAHQMDGAALAFDQAFDAVFSNAALHWMTRPEKVAGGIFRALKPGGRLVGEMGGQGNVAAIHTAILAVYARHGLDGTADCPWYFPSVAEYSDVLGAAGLTVTHAALIPRPTPVKAGMATWLETLAAPYLNRLDGTLREQMRDEIVDLLRPVLCDRAGNWTADYVRLRFVAIR